MIAFDVTKRETLNWCSRTIKDIQRQVPDNLPLIVVVGTKIDLSDQREVNEEFARKCLMDIEPSVKYFETSCKTGAGVSNAFEESLKIWIQSKQSDDRRDDKQQQKQSS